MFKRFDESDLLALIEDELDPRQAARLRRRLATEPDALAQIERMREDRQLLRSAPEPRLPDGLISELEPILARPMLMPDTSTRRRRRPWVAAVAAAVVLVVFGGLWATQLVTLRPSNPQPSIEIAEAETDALHATSSATVSIPTPSPVAVADETWPPAGMVVHHHGPLPGITARTTAPGETGAAIAARGGAPPLVPADFVLVVRAEDPSQAEQMLQRVLGDLDFEAALVRNFSYREADELEEARRLADGGRPGPSADDASDPVAGAFGGAPAPRRRSGQPAPSRPRPQPQDRPETRLSSAELLVGPEELAPSFERQIDFSDRGAEYTLSVPANRMMQVLTRLQLGERHQAALRREAADSDAAMTDEMRWLRDWPLVMQAAAALGDHGADAIILLPVVVEEN
ncbi:MAG: hypothetical protein ACYSU7_03715 [Planctomycetota bacterium]|jgi:hypothetical protein